MPENIEAKITETARDNQFTMIGDTHHGDPTIRDFVYGAGVMEALRDGGVKHVFIEMPQSLQDRADDLSAGKITRDEFIRNMNSSMGMIFSDNEATRRADLGNIADQITYARENGMKVHFADPGNKTNFPMLGSTYESVMWDAMDDVAAKNGMRLSDNILLSMATMDTDVSLRAQAIEALDARVAALPPEQREEYIAERDQFEADLKTFDENRLDDEALYNNVTEISSGQKSAILYGAGHDDLRQRLTDNGFTNSSIDVYTSKRQHQTMTNASGENTYDRAAYLDTDTVEKTRVIPEPVQPAPTSRQPAPAL